MKDCEIQDINDFHAVDILPVLSVSLSDHGITKKTEEFWAWKHQKSPFGRSVGVVATHEGRVVSVRPLMKWDFNGDSNTFHALRAVDTATHPEWRGRGLFRILTEKSIKKAGDEGFCFIFNSPNENSLPGYLKMGWQHVARLKVLLCLPSPLRCTWNLCFRKLGKKGNDLQSWGAISKGATQSLTGCSDVRRILSEAESFESNRDSNGYRTPRNQEYLYWRYVDQPNSDYGIHVSRGADGSVTAISVLRIEVRAGLIGAVILEVFSRKFEIDEIVLEIKAVKKDLKVDYVISYFSPSSVEAAAMRRCLFFKFPFKYINFAFRPLAGDLKCDVDPLSPESWDISYGELEVF